MISFRRMAVFLAPKRQSGQGRKRRLPDRRRARYSRSRSWSGLNNQAAQPVANADCTALPSAPVPAVAAARETRSIPIRYPRMRKSKPNRNSRIVARITSTGNRSGHIEQDHRRAGHAPQRRPETRPQHQCPRPCPDRTCPLYRTPLIRHGSQACQQGQQADCIAKNLGFNLRQRPATQPARATAQPINKRSQVFAMYGMVPGAAQGSAAAQKYPCMVKADDAPRTGQENGVAIGRKIKCGTESRKTRAQCRQEMRQKAITASPKGDWPKNSGVDVGKLIACRVRRLGPIALNPQPQQDGRGHEDRGIGPDDHTPDHREDKAADHIPAQHIKRNQRQQCGNRGHHGSAECFVDRDVQDLFQLLSFCTSAGSLARGQTQPRCRSANTPRWSARAAMIARSKRI